MTILVSSASPLKAPYSFLVIFEFIRVESLASFSKKSLSTWVKSNSKPGLWEKSSEVSFWKFHLIRILQANSSKSFRSSGSLRDLWSGQKSNAFFKTWISKSDNALWLRLKIVLEQNWPARRPSSVMVAFVGKPSDLTTELPIAKPCCPP